MPLKPGSLESVIQANIEKLIKEGYTPEQAAAIAYEHAGKDKEVIVSPRPLTWFEKLRYRQYAPGVVVVKGDGKLRHMFIITSNSYKDREHEWITTDALKNYVERSWVADDICMPRNTLRFWHKQVIGDIVWCDMQGPFLIELAREKRGVVTHKGKRYPIAKVWDYIEKNPDGIEWGASHGFKYRDGDKHDKTYHAIRKFETTVLPLRNAANPITFSGVI